MIGETKGGSLLYSWTQNAVAGTNTLGNGLGAIVYTPSTPILDVEQLGLFFLLDDGAGGAFPGANGVVVRLQWGYDIVGGPTFLEEPVEQQGTPGGGVRRDAINVKEWGPQGASFLIWRPAAAHYVKVGCFTNGAPGANARVRLFIERQGPSTGLQRQGGA